MLTLLVLGMIGLAIVAAVGYSIVATMTSAETLSNMRENANRMDVIADVLANSLRDVQGDGRGYPPMPEIGTEGYSVVPSWVGGARHTPWGTEYMYCPNAAWNAVAVTPGNAGSVIDRDASTYAVKTISWPYAGAPNETQYVVASEDVGSLTAAGIVGVIVSDLPSSATSPKCSDVSYNNGRITVVNGTVRAVFTDRANNGNKDMEIVRWVAPETASSYTGGDGSGLNSGNPMSLADALAMWRALSPSSMTIMLEPGAYTLTAVEGGLTNTNPSGSEMRIVGGGSGTTSVAADGGSFAMDVPEVMKASGVTLEGIRLSGGVGEQIVLEDVDVDGIVTAGGTVFLGHETSLTPDSGGALLSDAGAVTITGTVTVSSSSASAISINGGSLSLAGATANFIMTTPGANDSAIRVSGGKLDVVASSSIAVQGTGAKAAIDVLGGSANLNGATVNANTFHGIAVSGGTLSMNGSSVGSGTSPTYGITDMGAFGFSGGTSSVRAVTNCFAGQGTGGTGIILDKSPLSHSASPLNAVQDAMVKSQATSKNVLSTDGVTSTTVIDYTSGGIPVIPVSAFNRTDWSCS